MNEPHWSDMKPRERDGWIGWKLFGWRWVGQGELNPVQFALYPPERQGELICNFPLVPMLSTQWPSETERWVGCFNMYSVSSSVGNVSHLPRYSTDAKADFEVLRQARCILEWSWRDDDGAEENDILYSDFYRHLSEILRSRDPYYTDTVNQYELYYMDLYEPGDFSHAMYLAMTEPSTLAD